MTIKELKELMDEFERDDRHCLGIHLTAEMAAEIRRELKSMYGSDPGECLTTLYGREVLSTDAKFLSFEE